MQQSIITLLLCFSLVSAMAGEGERVIPSTLRSVTVYRSGAELVHTATARLEQGNNELVIGDVANSIDEASIRIGCTGNVTIMSVTLTRDYLQPQALPPFEKKLKDSIAVIRKELTHLEVLSKSDGELLELLSANKSIAGTTTGVSAAELAKMMDYYRQKGVELRTELEAYAERSQLLRQQIEKLDNQIKEDALKNTRAGSGLLLQLLSPVGGPCELTITYLTTAASWEPSYDLKVINDTAALHILYKAKLSQQSGIDWKHVKLSLSTSMPSQGGNAPILKTWFLQFLEPAVAMGYGMARKSALAGRVAGVAVVDEKSNALSDVVVTAAKPDNTDPSDNVNFNDRQMDAVFDLDIPYDVPGNGKEEGVVLKDYQLPCTYQYYATAGRDKDVYLLGQVQGWEKLNLLPGEANIMVEGTYVGKSTIDPSSTQDSLNLTLGRDKRIVVKKEKIVDYSSVKFLGSNKKVVFTYDITVRNNKKEKIRLLLKDQYPVSTSKDIEEELLESGGAAINKDTGILTWKLELSAGESRTFRISYSVKSPRDRSLNID